MKRQGRSSRSLNYACYKAEIWLKRLPVETLSLDEHLKLLSEGWSLAHDICAILSLTLTRVTDQAHGPITEKEPLLKLKSNVQDAFDAACLKIFNDETRWTTKSRSRFGLIIIQVMATISRTRDISLIERLGSQITIANKKGTVGGDQASANVACSSDIAFRDSEAASGASVPEKVDHFRNALAATSSPANDADVSRYLPDNFSLNLPGLRRVTNLVLGPAKQRANIIHHFEPATPRLVFVNQIDVSQKVQAHDHFQRNCIDTSETKQIDSVAEINDPEYDENPSMFPAPQWPAPTSEITASPEKRYVKTINFIKRNQMKVQFSEQEPHHTYGVLRTAEIEFSQGRSIAAVGISGSGKSTFLRHLPTGEATVFEIGSDQYGPEEKRHHYKVSEIDAMLRKAGRTSGRKILLLHEFFVDKSALVQFGVFDQFAFVGDPRQPGSGNAQHLLNFIRDIGGRRFTLPVVWRVGHPLSTMLVNYFAYGSQFRLCERSELSANDRQFDLMESDDDVDSISEKLVAYSLQKSRENRTVIIVASSIAIRSTIAALFRKSGGVPANVQCRQIEDIQGREADILVFDLHDVAMTYREPDQAIRYVIMLLGRARLTTAITLGSRNMSESRLTALPIEIIFGVLLRFRVRSYEGKRIAREGVNFERFSKNNYLYLVDENTIKIGFLSGSVSKMSIIKDRRGHNVEIMRNHQCMIEAPAFFDESKDLEEEIKTLIRLIKCGSTPGLSVYSLKDILEFSCRNGG